MNPEELFKKVYSIYYTFIDKDKFNAISPKVGDEIDLEYFSTIQPSSIKSIKPIINFYSRADSAAKAYKLYKNKNLYIIQVREENKKLLFLKKLNLQTILLLQ